MSLTESLFGGLLIIVALYFFARRFGLSNYWSAILSGVLPFLGYLGVAARDWPSGDVLAIHVAVFMATAGVLGVFGDMRQRRQGKMHWAPKAIIAFFVFLAIFNAALLAVSSHGVPGALTRWLLPSTEGHGMNTAFPGVVPHDRNKLYTTHQQRVAAQRTLGWKVEVGGLEQLRAGKSVVLVLAVRDAQGQPVVPDTADASFWRLANSKDDHRIAFTPEADGRAYARALLPTPGRWILEITLVRGGDVYQMQRPLYVG